MPDTYLSDKDLSNRYSITRNTVWRWHRERADFPRAVKLSPNCTRWKISEILRWEADQMLAEANALEAEAVA
ncbi:helix-turn-helix transcriptional regulator [Thalassovita taeanensis]|uniref:Transcriptional regulator, AlpA family n=1 Tax=Thalassovita taeanensis TaxID=657014 RepID=A0A1H8ZCH8_9RHOB|nr:AlpA family phage regulatory protein [Thalassovita taeanensis]SEP62119.1 transcriptional regulator, AlpA family [Thalassovita taeanensis]